MPDLGNGLISSLPPPDCVLITPIRKALELPRHAASAGEIMVGARKVCRFIWRSLCWYILFNMAAEALVLICSVAGFTSSDDRSCLPVAVLSIVLAALAYWPLAVALGVAQIGMGIYLGWRSMSELFWKEAGGLARAGVAFFVIGQLLQLLVNNADFPVWTAYKLAIHACTGRGP